MADHGKLDSEPDKFLLEEYKTLLELDKARNERLDRLLTMFLSLAGAPWALYALVIKDKGSFALGEMPVPIASIFLLVGLLGLLVVIMFVQTRFLIIMYMRAVNDIRGHFARPQISTALRLPKKGNVPHYYESGGYHLYAVLGMALVNGAYVVLTGYRLLRPFGFWRWSALLPGLVWVAVHYLYYHQSAKGREQRDSTGELRFRKSAVTPKH